MHEIFSGIYSRCHKYVPFEQRGFCQQSTELTEFNCRRVRRRGRYRDRLAIFGLDTDSDSDTDPDDPDSFRYGDTSPIGTEF
ncbi:hypothetical protein D3OALGA1CA_2261 [Olavius algarvensis associated proteobacterium Delta 3]|nr:hypothetical protein D3OALGA1CA_2261 [Olavius algarvensis associated proteobacterium Delta 3]CAB5165520.1 hypothetical protein D3OALGB2SA_5724 [Olavius algarvensis associated proteobacterium Delta 3]